MTINNIVLRQARLFQPSRPIEIKMPVQFMQKVQHWWDAFRRADEPLERDMCVASSTLITATLKRIG